MPKSIFLFLFSSCFFFLIQSCESKKSSSSNRLLAGKIKIDGSSTVYPITEAVAEEFRKIQPDVKVSVGMSGTGGGFRKFSRGETDINDASRLIKQGEIEDCKKNNIEYIKLPVAYDGLVVLVNKSNDWVDYFTVEELKQIWKPASQNTVTRWNQIRDEWPDEKFNLYGPGIASGTYDYFTFSIVGKSGSSRGDYMASEDDNVLVQGVSGDKNSIGFFGLGYYEENKDILQLIPIDNGSGPIQPDSITVRNGSYSPLSRPIFIYVRASATKRPEVVEFVSFYITNASSLASDVGYVPLPDEKYATTLDAFKKFVDSSR